jgi:hypothetical protein
MTTSLDTTLERERIVDAQAFSHLQQFFPYDISGYRASFHTVDFKSNPSSQNLPLFFFVLFLFLWATVAISHAPFLMAYLNFLWRNKNREYQQKIITTSTVRTRNKPIM